MWGKKCYSYSFTKNDFKKVGRKSVARSRKKQISSSEKEVRVSSQKCCF